MFQGCSGVVPGCSGGVPGCSGVFRGVPGCSGCVSGFTDTLFFSKIVTNSESTVSKPDLNIMP